MKPNKGALCQCAQHLAAGGAVKEPDLNLWDLPPLLLKALRAKMAEPEAEAPESTLAELREATRPSFRMPSSGRRPERLNASRDANIPLHLARGWAAGTLGLPGDIEGLGRMLIPGVSNEPALPTSETFQGLLPGAPETPAGRAATDLGSLFGGVGVATLARGAKKSSKAIQGALNTAAANARATGDLNVGLAGGQRGAIRTRGGNFNLGPPETWDGDWIPENLDKNSPVYQWQAKNLANYIKRDLGAPTDPLLALEKELPGLHFANDEAWPTTQDAVDRLYDIRRGLHGYREGSAEGQRLFNMATNYLGKHEELSGGAPLTRWGQAADSNVLLARAGVQLAEELADRWPMATMYPDRPHFDAPDPLGDLVRHTDNMISRYEMSARDNGLKAPVGDRFQKLKEYRQKLDEAMVKDWRAKTPDAETFSLGGSAPNDLGFNHMIDYLEAATAPYKRANFGQSVLTPEEMAAQQAGYVKDLLAGNVEPWRMSPIRRLDLDSDAALARAGLLVDPESLPRMSVADVSRKTAAWNKYLEEQQSKLPTALDKGWKTFKEYPEKGMKWVEFSYKDGDFFTPDTLPEGHTVSKIKNGNLPPGHMGEFTYAVVDKDGRMLERARPQPTESDALTEFTDLYRINPLREGLKAEGDTMGHCVGGYCDDVIHSGTKIYSLRDAKGRPHVTVEAAPDRVKSFTGWFDTMPVDLFNSYVDDFLSKNPGYKTGNGEPVGPEWKEHMEQLYRKTNVPQMNIVQIKGKQNAAPIADYLPYVQDFVKSGEWGRVGDLQNTGLRKLRGRYFSSEELDKAMKDAGWGMTSRDIETDYYDMLDRQRMDAADLTFFKSLGFDVDDPKFGAPRPRGYAQGGSVKPNEPDAPKGFLPRNFEQWIEYAEELYANSANGRT